MYQAWVGLGMALGALAARRGQPADAEARRIRGWITVAAVVGAAAGAHGLGTLAAWRGWIDADGDVSPFGARTVLGGMIGGWLAVEAAKRALGVRGATGDRFALPLAIALAFGRIGCWSAGCCGGRACVPGEPWHAVAVAVAVAVAGEDGVARVPVQLIEAGFHALAAGALWLAERRAWLVGRRLCAYLTAYAALRFVLETARIHPPVALGLTWFQWLALALALLAGGTWWRRAAAAAHPAATARACANDAAKT